MSIFTAVLLILMVAGGFVLAAAFAELTRTDDEPAQETPRDTSDSKNPA